MHVAGVSTSINLSSDQTEKLRRVLDRIIPIYPSPVNSPFPTLHIVPRDFLRSVLSKLAENSIEISSIRLHGGAASYVLVNDSDFVYRDIDILFLIQTPLSSEQKTSLFSSTGEAHSCDVWTIIKYVICSCLLEHISNASSSTSHQQYTHHFISSVLDTYAKKNIKISGDQDSWALLSLQNLLGQNLELKFVERLKRQWQFSVDSFQINLQPLIHSKPSPPTTTTIRTAKCPSISSITKTITTKNLTIEAINGLTILKSSQNDAGNENENCSTTMINGTSPLEFGFFTPSSSPDPIDVENNVECRTLATITTIATSNDNNPTLEPRSRSSKNSSSNDSVNPMFQFHISLNDDVDDGIEVDADDSAGEDDDQVFRTPVNTASAPSSPSIPPTIEAVARPPSPPSPIIEVYSVYNDVDLALHHLNNKLIATYAPETMRGGGLLKYCDLLARNYKPYDIAVMVHMQRYMCSRFFIDYKTIAEQTHVIAQYISTHFLPSSLISASHTNSPHLHQYYHSQRRQNLQSKSSKQQSTIDQTDLLNARLCFAFLHHLTLIIRSSTVCLPVDDKELILMQVDILKHQYYQEYGHLLMGNDNNGSYLQHPKKQQYASSSSNSSRSSSPSNSGVQYRYSHNYQPRHMSHRYYQRPSMSNSYPQGIRQYHNRPNYNFYGTQQTVPLESRRFQSR